MPEPAQYWQSSSNYYFCQQPAFLSKEGSKKKSPKKKAYVWGGEPLDLEFSRVSPNLPVSSHDESKLLGYLEKSSLQDKSSFFEAFKYIEGYLNDQLQIQKEDYFVPLDWYYEAAVKVFIQMVSDLVQSKEYEFIIKKRILKRFWGVLIAQIQNAYGFFKAQGESFKAWENLEALITRNFDLTQSFLSEVFKESQPLKQTLEGANVSRRLSSSFLLHLGDIQRYKGKLAKNGWDQQAKECWPFYNRARQLFPFEGKTFNQLAVLSAKEDDSLALVYYFMWALSCQFPFESAKESLINHLQEIRMKHVQSKETLKRWADRHFYDFILAFFRVQTIIYTQIEIDELESLFQEQSKLLNEYFVFIDREASKEGEVSKIQYLSMCMIFMAHAAIVEQNRALTKNGEGLS